VVVETAGETFHVTLAIGEGTEEERTMADGFVPGDGDGSAERTLGFTNAVSLHVQSWSGSLTGAPPTGALG